MIKFLIILALSVFFFSGCSTKKIARHLTYEQAQKYPVVMIANSDIRCSNSVIPKGAFFIVKEIGGYEYRIGGTSLIKDMVSAFSGASEYNFPDNALFIKLQEDYRAGFVVYPNGQFVYDNYSTFWFDDRGNIGTSENSKCSFDGEAPFTLKDNR